MTDDEDKNLRIAQLEAENKRWRQADTHGLYFICTTGEHPRRMGDKREPCPDCAAAALGKRFAAYRDKHRWYGWNPLRRRRIRKAREKALREAGDKFMQMFHESSEGTQWSTPFGPFQLEVYSGGFAVLIEDQNALTACAIPIPMEDLPILGLIPPAMMGEKL